MTREETKRRFKSWCQGHIGNNASDEDCQMFNNIMALLDQEPKTGHWIVDGTSFSEMNSYILSCHCSKCHYMKDFYDSKSWSRPCIENAETFNFCPNCGADMRGEK